MERKQFLATLRTALMQLNDFQSLRHSPLLPLLTGQPAASPLRLQQALLDAIEALKRNGAQERRAYEILYYRYVEQIAQAELAAQLAMSVRQLRREQGNALELLADMLWQKFALSSAGVALLSKQATPTTIVATATGWEESPGLQEEFAWLREQFTEQISDLAAEFAEALRNVAELAQHHQVTVEAHFSPALPLVAMPALILRQTLLTALTVMIVQTAQGNILVSAALGKADVIVTLQLNGTQINDLARLLAQEDSLRVVAQLLAQFGGRLMDRRDDPLTLQVIAPAVQGVPVLVIDDNPDTRRLFQRYADHSRFRVIASADADQVLPLTQEYQPRAILLDIMMPGIDGWDILTRLRHHPATQTIPVIVCSILPQQELARFLGASTFLQKPVSQQTFLATLHNFISRDP